MKNIEDGVIKYDNSNYIKTPPINEKEFEEIEKHRKILYLTKLIGCYEKDQIGYGNISCKKNYLNLHKTSKAQFLITGSQTGHLSNLNGEHYTRVVNYDIDHFKIYTQGPIKASSESLTHAAIYEAKYSIQVIIHIHNQKIWRGMINDRLPSTSTLIPYGTKEMALAVKSLINTSSELFFCMQGHEQGVVIYGENFKVAMDKTLNLYRRYIDPNFAVK